MIKKFDPVVKAFSDFCLPKKNDVYESFLFHSRNQLENEPFDNFLMELRKQVRKCEFGSQDMQDRMIRDRIVMGVFNKKLQKRLLEVQNLTLADAIDKSIASEVTLKQSKDMQRSYSKIDSSQVVLSADAVTQHRKKDKYNNNISFSPKTNVKKSENNSIEKKFKVKAGDMNRSNSNHKVSGSCRNCKYTHEIGRCPAAGKQCNNCGKFNHFAMACRIE